MMSCPFCGSYKTETEVLLDTSHEVTDVSWAVRCRACKAMGPESVTTSLDAVEMWNNRYTGD
jgi:Lar family restriction alleviation protein